MKDSLHIGIKEDTVLIQAEGGMRAANCFALNNFLNEYLEKTDKELNIFIDLNKCNYMDSTFIGFIISLTNKCRLYNPQCVTILNPSENARKSLKSLHTLDKLNIEESNTVPEIPTFRLEDRPVNFNNRKNIEIVFEAHKNLSEISEENRQEFQELMDELRRVLEKQ